MRSCLIAITIAITLGDYAVAEDRQEDDAVRVRVKERYGSVQVQGCVVDLTLENKHDFPVWFVFSRGNNLFPYEGAFSGQCKFTKLPLDADEYDEGHGKAIRVGSVADDEFGAFLLPPKGHLHFAGFIIEGNTPLRFVDVWEVKSLMVNGKTKLEEWLPYPIASSKYVEISGEMGSGKQTILGWKHDQDPKAKPYPHEKVETIKADPIRRQVVPLPE